MNLVLSHVAKKPYNSTFLKKEAGGGGVFVVTLGTTNAKTSPGKNNALGVEHFHHKTNIPGNKIDHQCRVLNVLKKSLGY